MENCLPFTDDVMVVLVHKCVQQTHLLALHLETLGYIPRLLNALNGLIYFLIIGDPRGDNLMVGSIFRKLLTELEIRTEDAECKLMGDKCNFVIFVLTRGVQYVTKTAQYIQKFYIYTLRNYFNLKACFLAKRMQNCSCPAHCLIYTSHFQDRVLKYTVI